MKMDDYASCYRCNARCHDFIDEHRGEIRIECCFCGAIMKVIGVAPIDASRETDGSYVLKFGRFKGMSIAEVSRQPRGVEYLELLAKDSPRLTSMINGFLRSAVSDKAATSSMPHRSPSRKEAGITGSQ